MTKEQQELKDNILRVSGADPGKCMKCGKCSGACPSYREMEYHPHQFVSMVADGRVEELMRSDAMWHCFSCFACSQRCPRDVEPARIIEAVRLAVIRQRGANRLAADDVPAMLDEEMPSQTLVSAFRKHSK